jgi:hypothetical protein
VNIADSDKLHNDEFNNFLRRQGQCVVIYKGKFTAFQVLTTKPEWLLITCFKHRLGSYKYKSDEECLKLYLEVQCGYFYGERIQNIMSRYDPLNRHKFNAYTSLILMPKI